MWKTIVREKASAIKNMEMDAMLLQRLACAQEPVLHLYDWEAPSITYGYFIDPEKVLHLSGIHAAGAQLARRPTGGGVIVHTADVTFSLLVPATHPSYTTNTLENYAWVNNSIVQLIKPLVPHSTVQLLPCNKECSQKPFCMAEPTVYDVMVDGKKVAGGAQRRTKHGYLHQGSISVGIPDESFLRQILKDPAIVTLMLQNTYALPTSPSALRTLLQRLSCIV